MDIEGIDYCTVEQGSILDLLIKKSMASKMTMWKRLKPNGNYICFMSDNISIYSRDELENFLGEKY